MRAIAGPLMPERTTRRCTRRRAGRASSSCARSPTSRAELAAPGSSVSQCGYNTALEVLRTRVPALVVPYATPEEDEQTRRARRLERLGALRVLADATSTR